MATDIKDKIAKLLALADSPNENEAKIALLRARELMAKHKLRPEDCVAAENAKVVRGTTGITFTQMTNPWAARLAAVLAEHYCCKAFVERDYGCKTNTIGLVGLEDDFEIAKRIFIYAYQCVVHEAKAKITRDPWDLPGTYRKARNAFGDGFVRGVLDAFQEQEAEHQEWGLVMVVPKAVTDSMGDMGKERSFARGFDTPDYDSLAAGYESGRQFDPNARLDTSAAPAMIGG